MNKLIALLLLCVVLSGCSTGTSSLSDAVVLNSESIIANSESTITNSKSIGMNAESLSKLCEIVTYNSNRIRELEIKAYYE